MSAATKTASPFKALFDRIRGKSREEHAYFHELEEVSEVDFGGHDEALIELASARAGDVFGRVNWDREAREPAAPREQASEGVQAGHAAAAPGPDTPTGHVFASVNWDREEAARPESTDVDDQGVASQPNTSVDDFFGGVSW